MNNIIEVNGLSKHYPDFSLSEASFTVPEGCITGFVGANGAGKTTTLRAILGLLEPDSGEIRLFGESVPSSKRQASSEGRRSSDRRALADRIGVVLGAGALYEGLTVSQMKQIVAGAYSQWQEKEYQELASRFKLNPSQKIKTLSSGTKMKLALAFALSHRAELLIMDEPTSGLDPLIRDKFLSLIREFMDKGGKGVLFSTHITSDLDKCADNIVFLHQGKILLEEDKDILLDKWRLVKGGLSSLTEGKKEFLNCLRTTDYGFTALIDDPEKAKQLFPDALLEHASIEDIMIALCEGRTPPLSTAGNNAERRMPSS